MQANFKNTSTDYLSLLKETGALVLDTHVVYTSGQHGDMYFNKDAIFSRTDITNFFCKLFAEHYQTLDIEMVIGPALGGIILAQWTAFHLSNLKNKQILVGYAEKTPDGNGFIIKRGYDKLIHGKKVLLVEDVITTGGSISKVAEVCRQNQASILGLAVLCNYEPLETIKSNLCVPKVYSAFTSERSRWKSVDCPLCKTMVPINTELGKGKFLKFDHDNKPLHTSA